MANNEYENNVKEMCTYYRGNLCSRKNCYHNAQKIIGNDCGEFLGIGCKYNGIIPATTEEDLARMSADHDTKSVVRDDLGKKTIRTPSSP